MAYGGDLPDLPKSLISVHAAKMAALLCPWCPDLAAGTQWCKDYGVTIRHDRCGDCAEKHRCERVASENPFKK